MQKKRVRVLTLIMILQSLAVAPFALGATYYVATTGSDSNSGTASQPFRTIQKAADIVQPGDAVYVRPGDYGGGSHGVHTRRSGTATARIRFVSSTKWAAKITATRTGWLNDANYVDVEGFEISGVQSLWGIVNWNSNFRAINNHVYDIAMTSSFCNRSGSGGAGIDNAGGGTTGNEVTGNLIHHIGLNICPQGVGAHGIYHVSSNSIIANNLVHHVRSWGIMSYNPSSPPRNVLIYNNIVYNVVRGGGIAAYWVTDHKIYNNTVYNNPTGIATSGSTIHVINNISYPNALQIKGSGTVSNNLVGTNPKFVNASANDFHLQSSSPAINAGAPVTKVITDFDGIMRPQGTAYDIGAYEDK